MTARKPLEGILVLDLSRLLPGPFLTMTLSDLGAEVIKVEDPRGGDYLRTLPPAKHGLSGRFLAVNRNKRSMALDLKSPEGRDAFLKLTETADVVVESFRPGVMDKLGVGWNALSGRNPRLVLCSISGFGQDGPYRDRAGHDLNYLALAGVLAMSGERGGPPRMPGLQIADLAGGALWAAVGILAALVGRGKTGVGRHVDISMTEGALALLAPEIGNLGFTPDGHVPSRGTESLNGGLAVYGIYRTKDNKYFSVAALEPKFYMAFCEAIGRNPDLADLVAPPDKQDEIRAQIQAVFSQKTRAEWEDVFARVDACCEPVLEVDEVLSHPLHAARRVFFSMEQPGVGSVTQVRTPVGEPTATRPAPGLGEHSSEVLGR
ncbi:MAG: CoA transferase [Deltaproteobacteria bacterium]|nr:CoA transferase [Deltaproteobacteria bacterium]